MSDAAFAIGLDYGTQSVRALVVDVRTGAEAGTGGSPYRSGDGGVYVDPNDPDLARQEPPRRERGRHEDHEGLVRQSDALPHLKLLHLKPGPQVKLCLQVLGEQGLPGLLKVLRLRPGLRGHLGRCQVVAGRVAEDAAPPGLGGIFACLHFCVTIYGIAETEREANSRKIPGFSAS